MYIFIYILFCFIGILSMESTLCLCINFNICMFPIATRWQCYLTCLKLANRSLFQDFYSSLFAFKTASFFILLNLSSFFCFSSYLTLASCINFIVFCPVKCHSGTFAGGFLVDTFSFLFGKVTKSSACTPI